MAAIAAVCIINHKLKKAHLIFKDWLNRREKEKFINFDVIVNCINLGTLSAIY
jgi:hypothetical protein